jgi:putative FmdB family regulatory protein
MPIYEYVCEKDGERLELIRPIAQADSPVEDPKGLGRTFVRVQSTFAAKGANGSAGAGSMGAGSGGCCPCGKGAGACSRN